MALYAIGDLHLSLSSDKPMEIFGPGWQNYVERIREGFADLTDEDVTVLCGDLSWGMSLEESDRGLSDYGREFIRELYRHHIYPDVSHLSDRGFWDLIEMAEGPVVASHSNSRALCPHRRNLTDEQFCAIRDSGGVVGLNFYLSFVGASSMDALVDHVEHLLTLGGEKTLCLGGDLDGCEVLAANMQGIQDVPRLYEALVSRGYDETLLYDLFWNNLRRLF